MAVALVVDDDKAGLSGLVEWVREHGFDVREADSVSQALEVLASGIPDLALIDLQLPDGSGIELVPALGEDPHTETVIITGFGSIDSAVEALRKGATDYLTKPIDLARLDKILEKVRKTVALRDQVDDLRGELRRLGRFGCIIGASDPMQQLYDLIARVAPTDSTVLLLGETGVGKELAARMVHELSARSDRRYVTINCGAVAPSLIESELFGHEKGGFTGADRRRRGIFEQADGGTLLLDEVVEMPPELQVKLLRVLERGAFTRVGGEEVIGCDVRIVAATNKDPERAVKDGQLREDLHYRLNVFPIRVPPLRDRGDDVELLARHFLHRLNEKAGTSKRIGDSALDRLRSHSWPGNVRELKNVMERTFILAAEKIEAADVAVGGASVADTSSRNQPTDEAVAGSLEDVERRHILDTLKRVGGHRAQAANILGISPKTLYNKLKKYGE